MESSTLGFAFGLLLENNSIPFSFKAFLNAVSVESLPHIVLLLSEIILSGKPYFSKTISNSF